MSAKKGKSKSGGGEGGELGEYRRKRDFRVTAEPAGNGARSAAGGELAFVVQKHAASHLHYDLRLEVDGVMRSWAVPKGPSLDPSVKRLAMQVEDHPIEYNSFEGTIPAGEYGGGTVMLWDRGTYRPEEPRPGESDAAAARRGLRAGKLGFTLEGERLRGSFTLVRTDRGPKPKWLLMKQRDSRASSGREITARVKTSVATGRTMEEIAGESDRVWRSNHAGAPGGEEPGDAPAPADGLAPMRPRPVRALPEEGEWSYEGWRGGERVLAYATEEGARLVGDRGKDRTAAHRDIAEEMTSLARRVGRPFVMEGELVVGDGGAELYATDLLVDGTEVVVGEPARRRREALESLLRRRRLSRVRLQRVWRSAPAALRTARAEGWPGLVARHADAEYAPGRASDGVVRLAAT